MQLTMIGIAEHPYTSACRNANLEDRGEGRLCANTQTRYTTAVYNINTIDWGNRGQMRFKAPAFEVHKVQE